MSESREEQTNLERQEMDVDIVCVGFGPAMGGFLTTLCRELTNEDGSPKIESPSCPGMPPQIICYERADDIGFGVSGVVSRARGIKQSFPELKAEQIPSLSEVKEEKVVYLLDPVGASRRSLTLKAADKVIHGLKGTLPFEKEAFILPYIPPFLRKDDGLIFSIGQFNQWVGSKIMETGSVQIWPGTPVDKALVDGDKVVGVQLLDQGVDKQGKPEAAYMPGMNIKAALTVVADGPIGAVGRQLDRKFGMPSGHHTRDWAVGMKLLVELPESCKLEAGTVIHTFGYPEPEIFGFMYVHPDRLASLGIFVPAWFDSPMRTCYRYLQHWMLHPYIWQFLDGGTMRSWGAKTVEESGKRGEPYLVGNGYARIGEGSGSTNVIANSGVDEAWTTGIQLAEAVVELLKEKKEFTKENLEASYVKRRRQSWVEKEGKEAQNARDGFQHGLVEGMIGTALAGFTHGKLAMHIDPVQPYKRLPGLAEYYKDRIPEEEIKQIQNEAAQKGLSAHNAFMDRCGWPQIPLDGKLLVSHQDALLMGGKVQATPGYADHVLFLYPDLCKTCDSKICSEICSGQAILPGLNGIPTFDREKCIHCGACTWSCAVPHPEDPEATVLDFRAGVGGLHSAEN